MDIGGLVSAFFSDAGPGGVVVLLVIGGACTTYFFLTRWIVTADKDNEPISLDEHSKGTDA